MKKPLTLSIIVPVYNEEKTLLPLLKKVQNVKLLGLQKQIIVVNDGSTDKTSDVIRKIKIPGIQIHQHDKNREKARPSAPPFPIPPATSSSSRTPTWNTTRRIMRLS